MTVSFRIIHPYSGKERPEMGERIKKPMKMTFVGKGPLIEGGRSEEFNMKNINEPNDAGSFTLVLHSFLFIRTSIKFLRLGCP